jgi:hypothetical protein
MLTHLESNPFELEFVGKTYTSDALLVDMLFPRVGTTRYMVLSSASGDMRGACQITFGS